MRDDFPVSIKERLAKRVAYHCSNPECKQVTTGPQKDPSKTVNIGVAAHITAASSGGPRYDSSLSSTGRQEAENGIWLCQSCAKLVDNDPQRYGVTVLRQWKDLAERDATDELENRANKTTHAGNKFTNVEKFMPDLIGEMRIDLASNPLSREFVILRKSRVYNAGPGSAILVYYLDDHPDLDNKLHILENYALIQDITYNNTKRYVMTEELAAYLRKE